MFIFSGTEGMARPLLSSDQAAALNTSDQEEERLLNEIFNFSQTDKEKKYTGRNEVQNDLKDTNSEKGQNLAVDEEEDSEEIDTSNNPINKELEASVPILTTKDIEKKHNTSPNDKVEEEGDDLRNLHIK